MTGNEKLTEYDLERASFEEGLALGIPMRTYKDRIFRMIFKEKTEFLELYNTMNNTSYDNPDDLVVTTLENAIYMGMKNDVSFMLYDRLALYEHQSSINPNMPLRDLFYLACVYSCLIRDENLFGETLIRIPEPKFIVFYNGVRKAVEKAVNECIREDILADFLRKNRSEVIRVGIFEYDEEKHMQQIREEGQKEGREEGRLSKLTELVFHLQKKGLPVEEIAEILKESPEQIRKIMGQKPAK